METLFQDLRFGARRLIKSPGFALIAILSLALGIGANTAIFSLVNTVLFRSLPVSDPDQIVSVAVFGKGDNTLAFSYPNYLDFRDRNDVLAGISVHRIAPMSLSRDGANERIWGYLVSGNYFDMLGVKPFRGRLLSEEDDRAKLAHPVAVISYGCWQRRFGANESVIGKEILVNGHPFKVIGVAPEGFYGTEYIYTPEIWAPMMMQPWIEPGNPWLDQRATQNIFATARLKQGISRRQAEVSLNLLAQQLGRQYPDTNEGQKIKLIPPGFVVGFLRDAVVSFSAVLMAVVGLVLLISCINLAGLLLARAAERRKEIAVRLAIGASRVRLIRQLLTESVLLSLIGGVVGVLLAIWLIDLVVAFKPPVDFPLTIDLKIDWRVMVFSILVSLATGVVFGLAPALQATRPDLVPALKDETRTGGYRRSRLRSGLVVAQISLSLVLLIAAGLVLRALQQVQTMNPGFEVDRGLIFSVDVGLQGYDQARGEQFYRQLNDRIRSLPGVRSVSSTNFMPLSLNYSATDVYIEGQPSERGANVPTSFYANIGLNYFETLGTPIVAGRDFSENDKSDTTKVVVVNQTFARRFFGGADPLETAIGKRIGNGGQNGPWLQIVGVARDGKYFSIGETPTPFIYYPVSQGYTAGLTLVVRTAGDPKAAIGAIREEIRKLDANLPVYDFKTLEEHMGLSLFPARVAAGLLGAFGLLALTLAAIGIYGVMAFSVAQRTREIGIRMALGAQKGDVLHMILRQGLILAAVGLVIGLAGAFMLTRLLSSVLYGVSATDAVAFIGVSVLLSLVVLLASFIPARRAAEVDPMLALRYE